MALLGRKKKGDGKEKKSGGIASMIGIETEAAKSPDEEAEERRHQSLIMAYEYVRQMLDRAVEAYYHADPPSRRFEKLERLMERPALDDMKRKLDELRDKQIYWQLPEKSRYTQGKPHYRLISEQLDSSGYPTSFVIEERFNDRCIHQHFVDNEVDRAVQAPSVERLIRVTINVYGDDKYMIKKVERDPVSV